MEQLREPDLDELKRTPGFYSQILTGEEIESVIDHRAVEISNKYGDEDLLCIYVNNGAVPLANRLQQTFIRLGVNYEFAAVRISRTGEKDELVEPRIIEPLPLNVRVFERPVLIVEDMIDEWKTMSFLLRELEESQPASIETAVIYERDLERDEQYQKPEYRCFVLAGRWWVVGYGPNSKRLPGDGGRFIRAGLLFYPDSEVEDQ